MHFFVRVQIYVLYLLTSLARQILDKFCEGLLDIVIDCVNDSVTNIFLVRFLGECGESGKYLRKIMMYEL